MIPGYLALPDLDRQHNEMHRALFRNSFYILPVIVDAVPTINTLPSGVGVIYEDIETNTRRLFININNNLIAPLAPIIIMKNQININV